MDILSAHHMVTATQDSLKSIARDFPTVKAAADTFVKQTNQKLEEREDNTDMEVEAALPVKRAKKRKRMAGEMTEDELQINAEKTTPSWTQLLKQSTDDLSQMALLLRIWHGWTPGSLARSEQFLFLVMHFKTSAHVSSNLTAGLQ